MVRCWESVLCLLIFILGLRDGTFILEFLASQLGVSHSHRILGLLDGLPHFQGVRIRTGHLFLFLGYFGSEVGPFPCS